MKIAEITTILETWAPTIYAEDYDNVGLLTGNASTEITGILCTLDCTEEIVEEALKKNCNLIIAHHPVIFKGIKKLNGTNAVERTVIKAIQNNIAIYAIHTNLDNVNEGVNHKIASLLGLRNQRILGPKENLLYKIAVFTPHVNIAEVRDALFNAGCGNVGDYSDCSFNTAGTGTFKAGENTQPHVGEKNIRHEEPETKIEVIAPLAVLDKSIKAMLAAHPYEEVAYDVIPLRNKTGNIGSGMIGDLKEPMSEDEFLKLVKSIFNCATLRHTQLSGQPISRVALCGGSGSFLLRKAVYSGAQAFISADFKYHEFFDAEGKILIVDTGHFESEQFTPNLIADYLTEHIKNISTFAVRLSEVNTNPVKYF